MSLVVEYAAPEVQDLEILTEALTRRFTITEDLQTELRGYDQSPRRWFRMQKVQPPKLRYDSDYKDFAGKITEAYTAEVVIRGLDQMNVGYEEYRNEEDELVLETV